jgi:hypothetical protein
MGARKLFTAGQGGAQCPSVILDRRNMRHEGVVETGSAVAAHVRLSDGCGKRRCEGNEDEGEESGEVQFAGSYWSE